MDIGKPIETITIEPIELPIPSPDVPEREAEPVPEPELEPANPELVPA